MPLNMQAFWSAILSAAERTKREKPTIVRAFRISQGTYYAIGDEARIISEHCHFSLIAAVGDRPIHCAWGEPVHAKAVRSLRLHGFTLKVIPVSRKENKS